MARVALVTGGTRGIGAAIAKRLKADGNTVVVCDVVDEQLEKFAKDTGIKGYNINIADIDSVKAGVAKIEAEVGPIPRRSLRRWVRHCKIVATTSPNGETLVRLFIPRRPSPRAPSRPARPRRRAV